ncbi:MAG: AAA family ATPase [Candidatus Zixiibacteriota bacterium]
MLPKKAEQQPPPAFASGDRARVGRRTLHTPACSHARDFGRGHHTPVLSEGERRALSLAAFLAEQSIGGGSGCLVFDDPVSSLDHWWAKVIADRLVEEARSRQVIVFTHDLVFYDKLCTAVEVSIGTET